MQSLFSSAKQLCNRPEQELQLYHVYYRLQTPLHAPVDEGGGLGFFVLGLGGCGLPPDGGAGFPVEGGGGGMGEEPIY